MKFEKGNIVELVNYDKSYTVEVTGRGRSRVTFAGVILTSEYDDSEYGGTCSAGYSCNDFYAPDFQLVQGVLA